MRLGEPDERRRPMAPKVQKKIASILPNSRFELVGDSGLVVHLEQPDVFFAVMRQLMSRQTVAIW